jgi:hypothetical protein
MLAAGWLGLCCQVDGVGGGGGGGEGTATQHDSHLSLPPILSDDILDSIKPALKLEGALL